MTYYEDMANNKHFTELEHPAQAGYTDMYWGLSDGCRAELRRRWAESNWNKNRLAYEIQDFYEEFYNWEEEKWENRGCDKEQEKL